MPLPNQDQGAPLVQGQTPLQWQYGFQAGFPSTQTLQPFAPQFQYYQPYQPQYQQPIPYIEPTPPEVCDFSDVSNYHLRHPYLQWLVSTLPPLTIPENMTNRDLVFYLFTHEINLPVLVKALSLMGSVASAACVRSYL